MGNQISGILNIYQQNCIHTSFLQTINKAYHLIMTSYTFKSIVCKHITLSDISVWDITNLTAIPNKNSTMHYLVTYPHKHCPRWQRCVVASLCVSCRGTC